MRADESGAQAAAETLGRGGVVVVPTDTVYGLAARPDDRDAVAAVYRAKGRPEGMHLPVLAASVEQVRALGVEMTAAAARTRRAVVAGAADAGVRIRRYRRARPPRVAGGPRRGRRPHPRSRLPAWPPAGDGAAPRHERERARRAHPERGRRRGGKPQSVRRPDRRRRSPERGPVDAGQRACARRRGRARGRDRARTRSSARWRWSREPPPVGHRVVVRRDGRRRRSTTSARALVGRGEPGRPARQLRRRRAGTGQPGPHRDRSRRSSARALERGRRRGTRPRGRRGDRPGPGWWARCSSASRRPRLWVWAGACRSWG